MRVCSNGLGSAISIVLEIYQAGQRVTIATLCEKLDLSQSYLEQVFAKLKKAKIVQGFKGPGGGYEINKLSSELTIFDVATALKETNHSKHAVLVEHILSIYTKQVTFEMLLSATV